MNKEEPFFCVLVWPVESGIIFAFPKQAIDTCIEWKCRQKINEILEEGGG